MGAAWWMFDHARGIAHQTLLIAEQGSISSFYGMLTDSRSFTSYARHDYSPVASCKRMGEQDDFPMEAAHRLLVRVCCENIREVIESGRLTYFLYTEMEEIYENDISLVRRE